ncbi:3'-phosphoadenosine 5'-phosphosulfate sulfotransferase (PAPS reductase)/FAD synthetase [Variovorax sp. GrIS 2.14]|uniref:methyltransferase domain-containing protein n=1 Tax=Variovorax sp. GrIS 2.14 TaxID=3071709 RepID=UPI0038F7BCCA
MNLIDQAAVDSETEAALARGVRVFNGALFGADEREHVAVLLAALIPPQDAMVLDAGCGVGEMAKLMRESRPDLQFLLVNTSAVQLEHCPIDCDRLLADFHAMPLPAHVADCVVFSYAICQSGDWPKALAEAFRVLKPGGILLINDMARLSGDNDEFEAALGGRVHAPETIEAWAKQAGFILDAAVAPDVGVERLRDLLDNDPMADRLLNGVVPTIWRFMSLPEGTLRTLHRHAGNVGFQFSGGRDSTAALYLMRPYWAFMRIYHVDTGDHFPETIAVVEEVERELNAAGLPLHRVFTNVPAAREVQGMPTDLVPAANTPVGRMLSGLTVRLQGRFDCCGTNLMLPLHARMKADGITLLVRGQRTDEYAQTPLRSGDVADGFEVLYPIEDWTAADVMTYLESHVLPIAHSFYDSGMTHGSDCMGCTGWWDEGRAAFLQAKHPETYEKFLQQMAVIQTEVTRSIVWLKNETGA